MSTLVPVHSHRDHSHRAKARDPQVPAPGQVLRTATFAAAMAILGASALPASATVLQFDQSRSATGTEVIPTQAGRPVPQDYGDRVGGAVQAVSGGVFTYGEAGEGYTPNIVVDYFLGDGNGTGAVQMWTVQYGDLDNVIFGLASSGSLNIRLTADAGYTALVHGFDLAGWPQQDYTIRGVTVEGDGQTLFEAAGVQVQGAGPTHTAFDFGTPLQGSQVLIHIDYGNLAGNVQDNIGLDNLRFGQTPPPIPEPDSWLLLAAGGVVVALARRRRR